MAMIAQTSTVVLIVGAGPAGLATAACLNRLNIPNILLEKEDCAASLWKKRAYDRLKLHLAKDFCALPNMPFPADSPTYVSKGDFIAYLDDYMSRFEVAPFYHRCVSRASLDMHKWIVLAENALLGTTEKYVSDFLVVATGENGEGFFPRVPGVDSFPGEVMHSDRYKNGEGFVGREVLVVGSGNSGMEIAYDLSDWGARSSVVVRGPVHVLTHWMVKHGMELLKHAPVELVDKIVLMLCEFTYGDLSEYGIQRPSEGPFSLKATSGRSPVIDVGTVEKIRSREIKVFPSVEKVSGNLVHFVNGEAKTFDAIVFATGYRSTVRQWLKDSGGLFGEDGMPKKGDDSRSRWKGENGLYCAGFAMAGLAGISKDARAISEDINNLIKLINFN